MAHDGLHRLIKRLFCEEIQFKEEMFDLDQQKYGREAYWVDRKKRIRKDSVHPSKGEV